MVLLSCKAGLRAAEQAGLDWMMVCDANGRVADSLTISNHIAKYGSGRRIPCHPELRLAADWQLRTQYWSVGLRQLTSKAADRIISEIMRQ